MNTAVVIIVVLLLIGLGVGAYFMFKPKDCPVISNGTTDSTSNCAVTCNTGYSLSTDGTACCLTVANGTMDSNCVVTCNAGYTLDKDGVTCTQKTTDGTTNIRTANCDQGYTLSSDGTTCVKESNGNVVVSTPRISSVVSGPNPVPKLTTIGKNGNTYEFIMQDDGNAVLYDNGKAIWSTGSVNSTRYGPYRFMFQDDGNWVVYSNDWTPQWSARVAGKGKGPYKLILQDNRDLASYDSTGALMTATHTGIEFTPVK